MTFKEILSAAKSGSEEAFECLLDMYRSLLMKGSIIDGIFNEDLFQEQCIVLIKCIHSFRD